MDNHTSIPKAGDTSFYRTAMDIETVSLPVICLVGFVGNTLSFMIFRKPSVAKAPCSLYLTIRSVSDSGFLSNLLLIWVGPVFDVDLGASIAGLCPFMTFLSYSCGFISVWLVVMVTIENFFRMCRPFYNGCIYERKCAKRIVILICVTALVTYQFPLWIVDSRCQPLPKYSDIARALAYVDTFLTLGIPTLINTSLLCFIAYNLLKTIRRRTKLKTNRRSNPTAKVTRMLFVVSLVYIILTLPSHIIRIMFLIKTYTVGFEEFNPTFLQRGIQRILLLLYYVSFAVNIFIYLQSVVFRKAFLDIMGCFQKWKSRTIVRNRAVDIQNSGGCLSNRLIVDHQQAVDTDDDAVMETSL